MKSYIKSLSKLLRYKIDKEDFEKAIDENPLDSLNHTVYADWLDENANTDEDREEAAFRRAMGGWVKKPHIGEKQQYSDTGWLAGGRLGYPEGVALEHMDFSRQRGYPQSPHFEPYGESTRPEHWPIAHRNRDEGDTPNGKYHLGYSTYRNMEEAFRRAFKKGKQR